MSDLCKLVFGMVIDLFRSRAALEAEILVLRQQINVLRRANPKRLPFVSIDNGGYGDQLVKLKVVLPKEPDPELEAFVSNWGGGKTYKPREEVTP